MRLRSIPFVYLQRLRTMFVPEMLAVAGIGIGVALLFAAQVAGASLSGSASQLASAVLGSVRLELQARSSQGFDQGMLARVRSLPGVHDATPVLEESANVIGPHGSRSIVLVGANPAAARFGGAAIKHLSDAQLARVEALAMPEAVSSAIGVGPLQQVKLELAGHEHEALVGLEVRPRENAVVARSPLVVAPLRYAQKLAGEQGRITRIFVVPDSGREAAVEREMKTLAAGRLDVHPASYDATLFAQAAQPIEQSTALFSAISALVGLLFAFYAMLFTVPHRRGFVRDLRLAGYTTGEVARILLFDALVLGVLAAGLGIALGELLSIKLLHANPGYLVYAFPVAAQRTVSATDIALAVAGAMLIAVLGVFAPARDIFARFRLRDDHASGAKIGSVAAALGAGVCLLLTTLVLLIAPQLALAGMAMLTLAIVLLLPGALDLIAASLSRIGERIKAAAPQIALAELRYPTNRLRSLAIAATGAVAVFGSVSIGGAHHNLQRGLDNASHAVTSYGALWVVPRGGYNLFTTASISRESTAARLGSVPGVRAVATYRGSFLNVGDRRTWVIAPPDRASQPLSQTQILEGSLATVRARLRGHGWIVVSQAIAAERHLRIGSAFHLPSPVPQTLRIAAIGTNMGWPPGAIFLNASDYARAWGSSAASAYLLALRPGASAQEVRAAAQRALGPRSGLTVETARSREDRGRVASRRGLAELSQISAMVLIAAILAMGAAMTTVIWQRRPLLAQMQVDGFDRITLWLALLIETALLLGAGCLTGALLGIYGQLLLSHALATVTGFPVVTSIGVSAAVASFAAVTAIAMAIVTVPGYAAATVRPAMLFGD